MKTPIIDFVKKYAKNKPIRFHMPGHKGKGFLGEKFDVTEIPGADVLYSANSIIAESELIATKLFSSAHTFYSCEGSSLCIKAMLYLVVKGIKNPTIIASRNVHVSFVNTCSLLGINVVWLYGKRENLCSLEFDLDELKTALELNPLACGVYVTSPDYLGKIAPVKQIAEICHNQRIPLLVDNAHASYSAFLNENFHPIKLGADLVCDSAHKTLPTLTGGAYLHVGENATCFLEDTRSALSLFASTSPSYLIMQSLDYTNKFLSENPLVFEELSDKINQLKFELQRYGYKILSGEPLKLVIDISNFGYLKDEFYSILSNYKIMPEMIDNDYCVFMISPLNSKRDLKILKKTLFSIPKKSPLQKKELPFCSATKAIGIKEATFKNSRLIPTENALGSICAQNVISCPPAVPIVVCGEVITKEVITLLLYYDYKEIRVIKN